MLQHSSLTSTPRPFVSPAPHPVGQALDVGGANAVISGVAGEYYFGAVLVVGPVDYPPFPVVQREGAEAGAHHDCAKTEERRLS